MSDKTTYAAAIVFSYWPLDQICLFMEKELNAGEDQIGLMRIDRKRDGKETNRTLLLVERSLLDKALEKGFGRNNRDLDFKITEYELREHSFPKEGYTRNYYIQLPEDLPVTYARTQLENKIDVLCDFGLFPKENKPRVDIPLKSRETGAHLGRAFVTFDKNIPTDRISLGRVLLQDTRLYTSEEEYGLLKCFWARQSNSKKPKHVKNRSKYNKKKKEPLPPPPLSVAPPTVPLEQVENKKEPLLPPPLSVAPPSVPLESENKWNKLEVPPDQIPSHTDDEPEMVNPLDFPTLE